MWTVLTILAGAGAFLSFGWGVRAHFRIEPEMPARMRLLSRVSMAAFLLFAAVAGWRGVAMWPALGAILLFALGSLVFWWAVRVTRAAPPAIAYTQGAPSLLYTRGPYAMVRHPFYLSYCLGWLATAVAAGPIQWLPAAAIIFWYHATARAEEARFAASGMAEEYARYRQRTGLILPHLLGRLLGRLPGGRRDA